MAKKRLDEATKKRVRAGRMLLAGKRPADVAAAVGVARQTVYTWKRLLDEDGIYALRAVPGPGRPAKLDEGQLEEVRRAVLQKPTEHWNSPDSPDSSLRCTGLRIAVQTPQG